MIVKSAENAADPAELLLAGAAALGLALEPATVDRFRFYADELLKWNARINLTGHKTARDIVIKHFLDSLAVRPWVQDLASLADLGAGAGFPGLPLKLVLPHLHLTLIEPSGKKTAFLHFITAHLGLTDVAIRPVHLTPALARQWGPQFDGVITRATFPLARYLALAAPLVKPGGRLLALKGPHLAAAEWDPAVRLATEYRCQPPEKHPYALPLSAEPRLLVTWRAWPPQD